ncbi:MAG TPA: hypothetical protein VLM85_11545 [Polyangiaceae bacterium]|nr:hypothetical protein [Polyangiaceae bacterium]
MGHSKKASKNITSAEEAVELANDAADAAGSDDYAKARTMFEAALGYVRAHGEECAALSLDAEQVLRNLAICAQQLEDYEAMLRATTELIELGGDDGIGLNAIALHQLGRLDLALERIDEAIARSPLDADWHQERACILLVQGRKEDAMQSVGAALARGIRLEDLLNDSDLAVLADDPRIVEMTRAKKHAKPARSLFERLSLWLRLFAKRDDLEFIDPASGQPTPDAMETKKGAVPPNAYPPDAYELGAHVTRVFFVWRHKLDHDVCGHLFLSLEGNAADVHEEGTSAVILEEDVLGTGLATFSVAARRGKTTKAAPHLLWSLEDRRSFATLEEYLTQGAARAFVYGGEEPFGCWQTEPAAVSLARFSAPKWTLDADLKKALVARGAEEAEADALLQWLGKDVTLLLPAPQPLAS